MGIIKVTVDDELEAKLRAAAHFGQQTLSAYCRRLLVDGVRNVQVPLEAVAKVMPRMPDVEPAPPAKIVPDTKHQQILDEMRRELDERASSLEEPIDPQLEKRIDDLLK